MKPTKEQIQWLWEQCGLKPPHPNCEEEGHMSVPCGDRYFCLPVELDLNSLFKYAVPLLDGYMMFTGEGGIHFIASKNELNYEAVAKKEEDAIFGAIYKALGGKQCAGLK